VTALDEGQVAHGGEATRPVRRGRRGRLVVKRVFDVVVAVAILVVLSPLFALIALLILLVDGRPVIFRQTRLGRFGEPFTIYKFRTMVVGAEAQKAAIEHQNERHGPLFKVADDPRITRSGRWLRRASLDELPQFVNVVNGTMSIVGPRPALPGEAEQFPPELRRREEMPQGITGLWQLDGQTDPDFGKYTELDLHYVDNWSLRLDLSIFVRTVPVILGRTFPHRSTSATPTPVAATPVDEVEAPEADVTPAPDAPEAAAQPA
jgi:lipopolysaccharide/colanic/teichoic acid biosynthesis glycosyltransferase